MKTYISLPGTSKGDLLKSVEALVRNMVKTSQLFKPATPVFQLLPYSICIFMQMKWEDVQIRDWLEVLEFSNSELSCRKPKAVPIRFDIAAGQAEEFHATRFLVAGADEQIKSVMIVSSRVYLSSRLKERPHIVKGNDLILE